MPLKVVHVNTADLIGGAGIAAYRLHQALNRLPDVESALLVGIRSTDDPRVVSVCRNRCEYLLSRLIHRLQCSTGLSGWLSPLRAVARLPVIRAADVVHLHHINGGFFSYDDLIGLSRLVPLVWTLHDMWGFTGSCHHAFDCHRWESGCGSCPHPPAGARLDLSRWHWRRKRDAYLHARLNIVTPSHWLAELSGSSPLMGHLPVTCIPNAVDTEVFKPVVNKRELRTKWGVPSNAKVVMIGSANLSDKQKGAEELLHILCNLRPELRAEMAVLLVGNGTFPKVEEAFGKERILSTGYIGSQEQIAECFAMADLFLHASKADNLPNTLVESIACGTPAVTFDVGGCGDVVRHLETGYLAQAGDFGDFARGIELLLTDDVLYEKVKAGCRPYAMGQFCSAKIAARHVALYQEITRR